MDQTECEIFYLNVQIFYNNILVSTIQWDISFVHYVFLRLCLTRMASSANLDPRALSPSDCARFEGKSALGSRLVNRLQVETYVMK